MKKVIKEEKEINLVNRARNILAKLNTRKLAAILTVSSMLAISGCGKKEEVQTASTASIESTISDDINKSDDTNNVKYRNRPLGGKIVDNHNQELYISKASDLERVIKGAEEEKANDKGTSTNNKNGDKKSTTNTTNTSVKESSVSTQTAATVDSTPTTNVVDNTADNTVVEQPKPELMEGESVTYSEDGSYVVKPSQDYVNPSQDDIQDQVTEQPSTDVPSTSPGEDNPVEENPVETPIEEQPVLPVENKGYVVLKKNYSDGTYFYVFVNNNTSYDVVLNDVNYANEININSEIYALAENDDALSYALDEGWAKVGQYSEAEYGILDSVYNMEPLCDDLVADALKKIEDANKEDNQALTLTPEN